MVKMEISKFVIEICSDKIYVLSNHHARANLLGYAFGNVESGLDQIIKNHLSLLIETVARVFIIPAYQFGENDNVTYTPQTIS